jgi:hypothetical protein
MKTTTFTLKKLEIDNTANNHPIDAVITWVNGSDPVFRERMDPFLAGISREKMPGAHPTRFSTVKEIRFCVLSILTFAPFIRKIFIVTAGQDPGIDKDISEKFPERSGDVKIVDHSEIFRGYEEYLPTFSSRSIETMIWRIEGLSPNFVYFNDDVFLIRRIGPGEWFVNDKPVLRGRWLLFPWHRILWNHLRKGVGRLLPGNPGFIARPSYHMGQWHAANRLGYRGRYFFFSHTPFAISLKTVEEYCHKNMLLLEDNIGFRFKEDSQFNFVALATHLELLAGNRQITNPDLAYLQPLNRPANYIKRKISYCDKTPRIKFLCAQSLDMCPEEERERLFNWMESKLTRTKPATS